MRTPVRPPAAARPDAAAASAVGQGTGTRPPSRPRTIGVVSRSGSVAYVNAHRPLSQFHSSLTAGSSPASRRRTVPRRWSVRWPQPLAQCSHTAGLETRSNGRARNRYAVPVSAPTGQIWTVLPEKYDSNGWSPYTPTCCREPRSMRSMNGSPAIWSEKRVHRAHITQRSRSSSTCGERAIGLGNVRLTSVNRERPCPLASAWFCSGHSPPLSQTGQSSGWLMSSSSITPRCALSAISEVTWVRTTIPSATGVVQEVTGLGAPSTWTMHWRHAPAGSSRGWSQKRGIWTPRRSAARMTSVPGGTETSRPSTVRVTGSTAVTGPPPRSGRRAWTGCGRRGSRRGRGPGTRRGRARWRR